jgi:hypothetical protein
MLQGTGRRQDSAILTGIFTCTGRAGNSRREIYVSLLGFGCAVMQGFPLKPSFPDRLNPAIPKETGSAESPFQLHEPGHSKNYLDMFPGLYYLYD